MKSIKYNLLNCILIVFIGEGGRLRLLPNNKTTVQRPSLVQPSPRPVAKASPSTRRIFMTKCMYYLLCMIIYDLHVII